jgi:NitT/TauT family transport system permease protein
VRQTLFFILLCLVAEVLGRSSYVPNYLMPWPSQVLVSLFANFSDFFHAFTSTGLMAFEGLILSIILGTLIGIGCSLFIWMKELILPIVMFFQTMPIIAIAPILVIWFGFGESTVRASSFIVSIFPVIASAIQGLSTMSQEQIELFKLYKAKPWKRMILLQIPQAIPQLFTGYKIAAGLAVIGALVGEFIGGGGLGGLIDSSLTQQRLDIVFGAVILSTALGLILSKSIVLVQKWISKWRPLF